jgi:hypothetical protein
MTCVVVWTGLENRKCGREDPLRWPRDTLSPKKLALTSQTSGCRSVGIVRSRTQAIEFSFSSCLKNTISVRLQRHQVRKSCMST